MSPAYYLASYTLLKLTGASNDMSLVLNLFNGVVFVVLQLLLYVLFSSLVSERTTAFFACLSVLLSPSIWLLSHQAHPTLLAMTLFVASLLALDRILQATALGAPKGLWWVWFTGLCAAAMAMRLDISLSFGAYVGVALYRRVFSVALLAKGIAAVIVALSLYASLRYAIAGYIVPPSGGTLSYHLSTRFDWSRIPQNIVRDSVYWAMAVNPLIFALAGLGIVFHRVKRSLAVLLVTWIVPYAVFFLFQGMDFARLATPTIPIIALLGVGVVASLSAEQPLRPLLGALVVAQLTSAALYYPLVKYYPFKIEVGGRPVADVPLGFLPVDHYYRQRLITKSHAVARDVTSERNRNVGIIGYAVMPYVYYLEQAKDTKAMGTDTCHGLVYQKYTSPDNEFEIFELGANQRVDSLLTRFEKCLGRSDAVRHIIPHSLQATLMLDKSSR